MKPVPLACALAFAALCFPFRGAAWDDAGHRQVADVAWTRLNARARQEIGAILAAGDARFRPAGAAEADMREAFRKAATFPDAIKFTKTTAYEGMIDAMNRLFFVTKPPDPADSEDTRCKTWHYYDEPIRDPAAHPPKESNALMAMARARYELGALEGMPAPDRKMQCWWLYWIVHIAGDLHQPLHCVSNYESSPQGDAGGNLFMIKDPNTGRSARLHGYWDGGITRAIARDKQQGLSATVEEVTKRWAVDYAPSTADAGDLDVLSWIDAGAEMADALVYTGIEKQAQPTQGYTELQLALCRRQAVLGGARLAAILNELLGR
jgi:hypothetical protein